MKFIFLTYTSLCLYGDIYYNYSINIIGSSIKHRLLPKPVGRQPLEDILPTNKADDYTSLLQFHGRKNLREWLNWSEQQFPLNHQLNQIMNMLVTTVYYTHTVLASCWVHFVFKLILIIKRYIWYKNWFLIKCTPHTCICMCFLWKYKHMCLTTRQYGTCIHVHVCTVEPLYNDLVGSRSEIVHNIMEVFLLQRLNRNYRGFLYMDILN